jgi:hypothetical protein
MTEDFKDPEVKIVLNRLLEAKELILNRELFDSLNSQLNELSSLISIDDIHFEVTNNDDLENIAAQRTLYPIRDAISSIGKKDEYPFALTQGNFDDLGLLLGSLNPEYRDSGAFFLINDLVSKNIISRKDVNNLIDTLSDEKSIFLKLRSTNTADIIGPSFRILVLAELFASYQQWIEQKYIDRLIEELPVYVLLLNNTEGFNPSFGWVHAHFHAANLTDVLLSYPERKISQSEKLLIFASTLAGYSNANEIFTAGEDQRFTDLIINSVVNNELLKEYFKTVYEDWLDAVSIPHPETDFGVLNINRVIDKLKINVDKLPADLADIILEK